MSDKDRLFRKHPIYNDLENAYVTFFLTFLVELKNPPPDEINVLRDVSSRHASWLPPTFRRVNGNTVIRLCCHSYERCLHYLFTFLHAGASRCCISL